MYLPAQAHADDQMVGSFQQRLRRRAEDSLNIRNHGNPRALAKSVARGTTEAPNWSRNSTRHDPINSSEKSSGLGEVTPAAE